MNGFTPMDQLDAFAQLMGQDEDEVKDSKAMARAGRAMAIGSKSMLEDAIAIAATTKTKNEIAALKERI